jgi:Proton-conducting membrane transporter
MEGPTPVSALIHAATMVTAGVYLLIRCSGLIEQSELALNVIMILGAVTGFFAASVGLFQNDIKKVIAYSTMSQLARKYNKFIIFRNRTIFVELIRIIIGNSQITKAHNYSKHNYISNNFFNSSSAMRQY